MSSRIKPSGKGQVDAEPKPTISTQPSQTQAAAGSAEPETKVSSREGLRIILNNPENKDVVRQFIFTTVLMFTVPFLAFFGFKYLDYAGLPIIHLYIRDRNLIGGIGAIVAVNLIIVWYVFKALTEPDDRVDSAGKIKKE